MKRKPVGTVCIVLLVTILMGTALTGCRESHVLEQKIYAEEQEIDYDNEIPEIENEEDNELEDEEISAVEQREESQKEREQQNTQAVRGNGSSTDTTPQLQYDQNARQSGDTTGAGSGSETSSQTTPAGVSDAPGITPSGQQTLRQIVDANGAQVEIPEQVATVTAVGETGVLIEMLGGSGRLLASSESFTSNAWVQTVFSADVGNVRTFWSGRGSEALSGENFQQLLEMKPSVCLINSGDFTFTDDQLAQLASAGIYTVTIPKLNNLDNIESTMRLLGSILGDQSASGGTNAPAVAEAYCRWAEGIIDKVDGAVDAFNYNDIDFSKDRYANRRDEYAGTETDTGLYTLFLSEWDSGATFRLYSDSYQTMSGSGVAIAPSGYSTTPLSYYLSEAGVVNTAAITPDNFTLKYWYINPLDPSTRAMDIQGALGEVTRQFLTVIKDPATASNIYLGDERFPAVVAASNAVKEGLESNAAAQAMWTVYPMTTSADGQVSGYGFQEEQGQIVSSTIHGAYGIYVLPDGAGSWNYASAEGVLASMWAAVQFQGVFSEADLRQEIAGFYSQFYHYDLSDEQLTRILAGR